SVTQRRILLQDEFVRSCPFLVDPRHLLATVSGRLKRHTDLVRPAAAKPSRCFWTINGQSVFSGRTEVTWGQPLSFSPTVMTHPDPMNWLTSTASAAIGGRPASPARRRPVMSPPFDVRVAIRQTLWPEKLPLTISNQNRSLGPYLGCGRSSPPTKRAE